MSTSIQQYEGSNQLVQYREPEQVLADAKKAAVALKNVLELKPNKVMFNNEQYLEREDWGTVARFYNATAKCIETKYVEFRDGEGYLVRGWEAVAVVIDMTTMNEIGRAESMTLDDEENWGEVPKYEWKDKLDEDGKKIWNANLRKGKGGYEAEKVLVGTTPKPLFQLRSMAQTRAEAKALKSVFGWVVVLAGYKTTPAEELTGHEDFDRGQQREQKQQVQQPQRASDKKPAAQQTQPAQGQQHPEFEIVSDIIGDVKEDSKKQLWLSLKKCKPGLVVVPVAVVDGDMKPGRFIKFRGLKLKNEKLGEFYELKGLMELTEVQDAEPVKEKAPEGPMDPEMAKLADEIGEVEDVQKLKDSGAVKSASDLPAGSGKKPGTIGLKRAQRLYIIAGQHVKETGFTEAEIKRLIGTLPVPLEHLRDLEVGMQDEIEMYCDGRKDWREFYED